MADDSVYNTGSTITWLLPRRGVGQIKGGFSWLKGEQSSFQNVWGGQIGALLICGQVFLSPRDYRADHSSYLALGLLKFWFLSPLISYFSSNFIFWVVVVGFKFTFFRVVLHELDFSVLADGHRRYEPLIYFGQKTNSRTHIRDGRAASISPLARSHKNLPKPIWYSTFKSIRHICQLAVELFPNDWRIGTPENGFQVVPTSTSILSLFVSSSPSHHSPTRSKSGNVNWRIEEDKNPEIREQPKKEKVISLRRALLVGWWGEMAY